MLTTDEFAKLAGIAPATLRGYVSRKQAPPPDAWQAGRRPRWREATAEAWIASRPGRGNYKRKPFRAGMDPRSR